MKDKKIIIPDPKESGRKGGVLLLRKKRESHTWPWESDRVVAK